MHRVIAAVGMFAVVTLAATTASAQLLNQPTKGKSFKSNIMMAYEECTVPTTITGTGVAACVPVRADTVCGFSETKGQGKFQLKSGNTGNYTVRAKFNKLSPACEGHQINFDILVRRSGEHCAGDLGSPGNCTMIDQTLPITSCTVINNSCKASEHFFLDGGSEQGQNEIREIIMTNTSTGKQGFYLGIVSGKILR